MILWSQYVRTLALSRPIKSTCADPCSESTILPPLQPACTGRAADVELGSAADSKLLFESGSAADSNSKYRHDVFRWLDYGTMKVQAIRWYIAEYVRSLELIQQNRLHIQKRMFQRFFERWRAGLRTGFERSYDEFDAVFPYCVTTTVSISYYRSKASEYSISKYDLQQSIYN